MFTACALNVLKSMIFFLENFFGGVSQLVTLLFTAGICSRLCRKYCVFCVLL